MTQGAYTLPNLRLIYETGCGLYKTDFAVRLSVYVALQNVSNQTLMRYQKSTIVRYNIMW